MPSGVTAAASSQASLREEPIEWTPSTKNKDAELPPIPGDLPKWLKKMLGYLEDWMKSDPASGRVRRRGCAFVGRAKPRRRIFVRKGPPAVEDVDINKYVGRWYLRRADVP